MFTSKFFELVTKAGWPCAKVFLEFCFFFFSLFLSVSLVPPFAGTDLVETACVVEFLFLRTLLSRI